MPRMIISGTLPSPLAITCHPWTAVLRNRSVLGQLLCIDNDLTFSGCLAASCMPTAAPSDRPAICAFSTLIACKKAAMSSAKSSVE